MAGEGKHREEDDRRVDKSHTHAYGGERGKKRDSMGATLTLCGRVDHHTSREPRQRAVGGVRA